MAVKINARSLTKHLNLLGAEAHDIAPDGTPITREEALARLLWNKALGYEEQIRDDEGTMKKVYHKPESWAMQYVYDRKEGRAVPVVPEDGNRIKAADKVRELAKARLNERAAALAGVPAKKGPPPYKGKK